MTSLLITLLAIAVVALIAAASAWYGGDALTRGQSAADAATLIATGEQLKTAFRLYYNDHATLAWSATGLPPPPYLNGEPAGWTGDCTETVCLAEKDLPLTAHPACQDLNQKAGLTNFASATVSDLLAAPFFCSPLSTDGGTPTGYRVTFVLQH